MIARKSLGQHRLRGVTPCKIEQVSVDLTQGSAERLTGLRQRIFYSSSRANDSPLISILLSLYPPSVPTLKMTDVSWAGLVNLTSL